jgi:hypothetical protein
MFVVFLDSFDDRTLATEKAKSLGRQAALPQYTLSEHGAEMRNGESEDVFDHPNEFVGLKHEADIHCQQQTNANQLVEQLFLQEPPNHDDDAWTTVIDASKPSTSATMNNTNAQFTAHAAPTTSSETKISAQAERTTKADVG